jgi:homoserine kinase
MGGTEDAVDALRTARIPWCVSGSGPTLLAFEQDRAVDHDLLGVGAEWRILRPGLRLEGFTVG